VYARLSEHAVDGISRSADAIQKSIADGEIIYGKINQLLRCGLDN
jgi:histidine ammonia-lyase